MATLAMHRPGRWALALCVAACGPPRSPAAARAPPELGFPRIASYFIETHIDAAAREVMSRSDLVIVDAEAAALDRAPRAAYLLARRAR